MEIKISKKIYDEIKRYCEANNIVDIPKFIEKLLKKGFDLEKWGDINYTTEEEEPKQETQEAPETPKIVSSAQKEPENIIKPTTLPLMSNPYETKTSKKLVNTEKKIKIQTTNNQQDKDIYGDED
jgi:hypothetical protein